MTPDEMIEVIQGWASGRGLQWKLNDVPNDSWSDVLPGDTPSWNFKKYSYRIKPEPKKPRYILIPAGGVPEYREGRLVKVFGVSSDTVWAGDERYIRFVEVLE